MKTELGFQGFVVTDWGGQHSGVASALAGLDMAMPTGDDSWETGVHFWGPNFTTAFTNGSVPESRLDDMATRYVNPSFSLTAVADCAPESLLLGTNWVKTHPMSLRLALVCPQMLVRLMTLSMLSPRRPDLSSSMEQ